MICLNNDECIIGLQFQILKINLCVWIQIRIGAYGFMCFNFCFMGVVMMNLFMGFIRGSKMWLARDWWVHELREVSFWR